jgi:carbon monoxide dehydrogenase subunit G
VDFRDGFTIAADPDRVWEAMLDPSVMRQVLPGCRRLDMVGPERFDVTLAAGIGVFRGVFSGDVQFADLSRPERCSMDITAHGSLGRVVGRGTVVLTPEGTGTNLAYAATFTFAGPMAGLGDALIRGVATTLTRDAMNRFSTLVAEGAQ